MDNTPLVSVVIPMYNVENYIGETLQSILNQTYKNIEIIVVDDGSKDKSAEVVKDYQQKNACIRYIFQENSGVSAARNRGIEEASGEYIAFLDSDDLWLESKIEKQLERISSTGMGACYCGFKHYTDGRIGREFPERYFEGTIFKEVLQEKTVVWTSSLIVRREIIQQNNLLFEKGCSWAEDMEFFAKLMCFTKVCCVKEHLALYRQRENSLSYSPSRLDEIKIWNRFMEWLNYVKSPILYSKDFITDLLNSYRIPGVVIFCLYETFASGTDMLNGMDVNELRRYIPKFRPNTSSTALKLLVKKYILKYKFKIR